MEEQKKYDIFISYRRKDTGDKAEHLKDLLEKNYPERISFDRENLSGLFDVTLLNRIDTCKDFIIVIGKNTFNYCEDDFLEQQVKLYQDLAKSSPIEFQEKTKYYREHNKTLDFIRIEIARALNREDLNIIPIVPEGTVEFNFNSLHLPKDIVNLKRYEAVFYSESPDALFKDIIPKVNLRLNTKQGIGHRRTWRTIFVGLILVILICMGLWTKHCITKEKISELCIDTIYGQPLYWNKNITLEQAETVREILSLMLPVEGGEFLLGAAKNQYGEYDQDVYTETETPQIETKVLPFRIHKYELSISEWGCIMGEKYDKKRGNFPKADITFDQAQKFIDKLNNLTGLQFDLPTEAEWEYAARGGKKSKGYKYAGSNNPDVVAWYEKNSNKVAHCRNERGFYCNELELYDMSGNVSEWCNTDFREYSDIIDNNPNPTILDSTAKVIRGGNYMSESYGITVYHRDFMSASFNLESVGMRLVLR